MVPLLDNTIVSLQKKLEFMSSKLKEYSETKARRSKLVEILRNIREKNNKARREQAKNKKRVFNRGGDKFKDEKKKNKNQDIGEIDFSGRMMEDNTSQSSLG